MRDVMAWIGAALMALLWAGLALMVLGPEKGEAVWMTFLIAFWGALIWDRLYTPKAKVDANLSVDADGRVLRA